MCVLLDEFAAGRHFVAHQHREDTVRFGGVLDIDLTQNARVGVHRRVPQLMGVHLAETFVTLDVHALAEFGRDGIALLLGPAVALLLALFTR